MGLRRPRGHHMLGTHKRRAHGVVRCVLRISPVGLVSALDLLGVNLDAEREDLTFSTCPSRSDLPLFSGLSLSVVRGEDLLEKHQHYIYCKISGPLRQPEEPLRCVC